MRIKQGARQCLTSRLSAQSLFKFDQISIKIDKIRTKSHQNKHNLINLLPYFTNFSTSGKII